MSFQRDSMKRGKEISKHCPTGARPFPFNFTCTIYCSTHIQRTYTIRVQCIVTYPKKNELELLMVEAVVVAIVAKILFLT